MHLKSQLDREHNEKDAAMRQLKEVREDSRRRVDALERRNTELESDNVAMHQQIKHSEAKKSKQNDLQEKVQQLEAEKMHFQSNMQISET